MAPAYKIATLSLRAEQMGRSLVKEVVNECSTELTSCGESSRVMEEKDDRGFEDGGGAETGAFGSCLIGHLGKR